MVSVFFLNAWGHKPQQIFELYRYLTPKHDGVWEDITISLSFNDADYYIVMDDVPSELKTFQFPKEKTIFLQREPEEIKPITFRGDAFFYGTYDQSYHAATWRLKKPFSELVELLPGKKQKQFSSVMSGKTTTLGQKQRVRLLNDLAHVMPDIEIFGNSLDAQALGSKYKGPLNYDDYCKFEGLYAYQYSLACENSSHPNYFTEKIIDCFLTWTKPIYCGCPNIENFFPSNSMIHFELCESGIVDMITTAVNDPIDYDALHIARRKVLFEYNLMATVKRLITTYAQ